jgi:photosystem II stability/assembly factor-like uncharacterized protein
MPTTWECLAADSGGTVSALTYDGRGALFAGTPVGLFVSSDGGNQWRLTSSTTSVPFVEAVALSPRYAQDRTIFICAGDGLYRSADGGQSWCRVLTGDRMLSVTCTYSGIVVAGSESDGVLRSEDSGINWTGANAGLLDLTGTALALSPEFESDRLGFAGTPSGLYRTRNGAQSWRAVATDFADSAVQCLAFSPNFSEDRLVLAGTESDGLLRSRDAGTTWHQVSNLNAESVTAIDFSRGGAVAVATESGVALSSDGGETWRTWEQAPDAVLALAFIDETLLAGLHRHGVMRLDGFAWSPANYGLNARLVTGLVASPDLAHDRTLYSVGLDVGVRQSLDGGSTWEKRNAGLEDSVVFGIAISPDFAEDHTLYSATSGGVYVSRDRGAHWLPVQTEPVAARVVATNPPQAVFAALETGALLVSEDGGRTWRTHVETPFGDAEVVSLDLSRDRALFVATRNGVVWRSLDGGARWQRWLVEPATRDVAPIAVSPGYRSDERVFVGVGGRVLTPLRSTREVRSGERRPMWTGADLGGAETVVLDLAIGGRRVFAATNRGVFVSRSSGAAFEPWSEGLPEVPMVALAVSPDEGLVFGVGLGGTIWRRQAG